MFQTSKISFCGKQACNVVEDSFKGEILDTLQKNYYVSIKDRNFYILNQKNIKYIERNPHILSVKSSGSLYYLFLTKINGGNFCFFIDKKIKDGHNYPRIISINYRFDDELFDNTLFDGELLRDKDENWLYIINNLVIHKGTLMKDKHINQKLNIVYNILTNHYQKDTYLEICPLYVKRLFSNHEFDYYFSYVFFGLKSLNTSGIVIMKSAEHASSSLTKLSTLPIATPLFRESSLAFIIKLSPGIIFLLNFALFMLAKFVFNPLYSFRHKNVIIKV